MSVQLNTRSVGRRVGSPAFLLLICGAFVILGSLGTWVSTPIGTVSGADGVGWLGAFLGGLILGWSLLNLSRARAQVALASTAMLVGIAGVSAAFVFWATLQAFGPASWFWDKLVDSSSSTRQLGNVHFSTGWGLYLLFIGSLAMTVVAVVFVSGRVWSRTHRDAGDPGRAPSAETGVAQPVESISAQHDPLV